jgi:hypothetical protein
VSCLSTVKGDFIEALWTEDGKVKGWFAAEVLVGDWAT